MHKFAAITGFLGSVKNRFINYQGDRSFEEKMRLASRIENLSGVELCYPADFEDIKNTQSLLKKYKLGVSAINFRSRRTGTWLRGSFSSEKEKDRREVVEDLKKAMDYSIEVGCKLVSTCPLNEGTDYLFEADYESMYDSFAGCLEEAASYNPEVKICLEYKWSDPRARSFIGNAGEALGFCHHVGLPNVGVNLDIGHSLYSGERPAQSAVMLTKAERLFYIHLNDNDKFWDWDMIPGAYNLWDFLEFFYYLKRIGYDGWFGFDIFPKEYDTVETFDVALRTTLKLMEITDRIDEKKIKELHKKRNPAASVDYLFSIL